MNEETFTPLKNHLEFLGYHVEIEKSESGFYFLRALSKRYSSLRIYYISDMYLIHANFGEIRKNSNTLNTINSINRETMLTKWEYNEINNILIISTFFNVYTKEFFGELLRRFESDIEENISKFID